LAAGFSHELISLLFDTFIEILTRNSQKDLLDLHARLFELRLQIVEFVMQLFVRDSHLLT
jgi:hypothetical protein